MRQPVVDGRANGASSCGDVVVADDAALFRKAMVRQLQVLKIPAHGVASVEELERCLESDPPRAVLLDWHFGGSTAAAVLDLLRARWVPVIVLTGDPGGVVVTGVPVLGKPVELSLLKAQLDEVLAGTGRDRGPMARANDTAP